MATVNATWIQGTASAQQDTQENIVRLNARKDPMDLTVSCCVNAKTAPHVARPTAHASVRPDTMGHSVRIVARLAQPKFTAFLIANVRMGPDVTLRPENVPVSPDGRVRFAPSHVTRERLAPNVIQPVVAITTRPVTPRLARVFAQLGTSAKNVQRNVLLGFTVNSAQKNATVKTAELVTT